MGQGPRPRRGAAAAQRRVRFRCLMFWIRKAAGLNAGEHGGGAMGAGQAFLADADGLPLGALGEAHRLIQAHHIGFQGTARARRMAAAPLASCTRPPGS